LATLLLLATVAAGCRPPRAIALPGVPVPARLPDAGLPPWHQHVVFSWDYDDAELSARGEGVARVAPPDSARIDLFLAGGFGSGTAYLLDSDVVAPGGEMVRRFLPPPPILWAAFGRLAVPAAADTTARLSGDTLRADIGRQPTWRVTFVGDRLAALDRIEGGRVVESVVRAPEGGIRYDHRGDRRALVISVTRAERSTAFDASIWRP
jgi:hypothetical protein